MLLNVSNLSKSFGDVDIINNASFSVFENDKIGLIGDNGMGKTTLFKLILGELDKDSGEVIASKELCLGYVGQYSCTKSSLSVYDEALSIYADLIEMENKIEELRLDIERGKTDKIQALASLNDEFLSKEGAFFRSKVKSMLLGLGFSEDDFSKSVSALSGGQKTRLALGKLLLSKSNLLLLDEPTNHLDIASIEWLEEFLQKYNGAFIVISHDRTFLDRVTNKIFRLHNKKIRIFNGNYTDHLSQLEVIEKTEQREYEKTQAEINRLNKIIEQQHAWNRERNIKTADSKQKIVDKLTQSLVVPEKETRTMSYRVKSCGGGGNDVISVKGLCFAYPGKPILKDFDFELKKGERVFLLGPNGSGKTTLIKLILGEIEPSAGEIRIGAGIKIGYYDQLLNTLSDSKTIFDEIYDAHPRLTGTEIRNALAMFNFTGEKVFDTIASLSGGERARVELCKLCLKEFNLLIMDEPTNHLDMASREKLEEALSEFDGTMLVVSHDRAFINNLASRTVNLSPPKEQTPNVEPEPATSDYFARKELERAKRKHTNDIKRLEAKIEQLEQEEAELTEAISSAGDDYELLVELSTKLENNKSEMEKTMEDWLNISEKGTES